MVWVAPGVEMVEHIDALGLAVAAFQDKPRIADGACRHSTSDVEQIGMAGYRCRVRCQCQRFAWVGGIEKDGCVKRCLAQVVLRVHT